jgi:GNAT superfamily N-acetyltransferase
MNTLHIRNARDTDRAAVREVTLSAYQEYGTVLPAAHWQEYRQGILATLASPQPAEQIVAEQNGAIVGAVLLYPAGTILQLPNGDTIRFDWPEVRLLAVAPAARGQGIGAALMQACIERARQAKSAILTLHTTDMMQTAMRMYKRMGFERAPELDFRPAEDVLVKGYRLDLEM